ncbi:MAG: hypothetical protein EBY32_12295 [Proteobacteria bacterium]|nr:hypothetical protein [Pseudomonadota bacterium]
MDYILPYSSSSLQAHESSPCRRVAIFWALILLAVFAVSPRASAANLTWSNATVTPGGNGNWTGGNNWYNGTTTVSWANGDDGNFTAAGNTTVNSNVTAGNLTFTSSTANISILAGAGNLTVNSAINASNSANTTALTYTIGSNIILGGTLTLSVANGGTVGTTNLLLSGNISGANGITKSGNGTLSLNGTNSFTGQSKIDNGVINIITLGNYSESSSLGQGTAGTSIRIGSSTASGTLVYNGVGNTSNRTFQIGSGNGTTAGTITNNGSGALVFSASSFNTADTTTSNRTLTLSGTNTNDNEIKGVIIDNNTGTIGITKDSTAGKWILTGANTYTGQTIIKLGILSINTLGNYSESSSLGKGTAGTSIQSKSVPVQASGRPQLQTTVLVPWYLLPRILMS